MATKTASPRSAGKANSRQLARTKEPVLGITRYENVRSFMWAILVGLVLTVGFLFILYLAQREPVAEDRVALEMIEIPGGAEDGALNETLKVDSPEPPTQDAALTDIDREVTEIQETLENVIDVADQATSQAPQQFDVEYETTGKIGSATGNGKRALGSGGDGAGVPREQRWYVRFSDSGTIDTYAAQLDFFKIQFGLLTRDGRLVYVWNFSQAKPDSRSVNTGKGEDRLHMTWQGGGRKTADVKLFQKAGIDGRSGSIFHFYPAAVEQSLARLELGYRNRKVEEIRRTYFVVEQEGSNYKFVVTRQTYFN